LSPGLEVFAVEEWPGIVAQRLNRRLLDRPGSRLCLATGNTTRPVYRETRIDGEPAIFLLDEFGGLPRNDPARCSAMLRRALPGYEFHAPDVDSDDPAAAASEYGRLIDQQGLDLALVGLGRNGHLGLNEPGSTRVSATRVVELAESTATGALAYGATMRPNWGITIGIHELLETRELWLLVTGRLKRDILTRTMTGPIGPELPATFVREHPNAFVLADTAAAVAV
jgi:glucosamine-6-phosphate deaminase